MTLVQIPPRLSDHHNHEQTDFKAHEDSLNVITEESRAVENNLSEDHSAFFSNLKVLATEIEWKRSQAVLLKNNKRQKSLENYQNSNNLMKQMSIKDKTSIQASLSNKIERRGRPKKRPEAVLLNIQKKSLNT